jgi:Flp pilus assembly pilin Flp
MAEYGIVLGVITLAIVTTLGLLSGGVQGTVERIVGVFS